MKILKILSTIILSLLVINFSALALAQTTEQPADQPIDGGTPQITLPSNSQTIKSNTACVAVGSPSEEKPAICNETTSTSILTYGRGQPGNFTFYCQGNPQWDQKGNNCSIGQIGCGPTSLAMIFSYFGDTITPDLMYKTYVENNMINCGVGSIPGLVNSWVAKQPGYEVGPDIGAGVLNATEAKKYIDAGWIILASSDNFIGQKGNPIGHIFVVQDVDPAAGTFVLRDPENCNYGTGEEFTKNIIQPILGGKVPSWKYAYPIRKKTNTP